MSGRVSGRENWSWTTTATNQFDEICAALLRAVHFIKNSTNILPAHSSARLKRRDLVFLLLSCFFSHLKNIFTRKQFLLENSRNFSSIQQTNRLLCPDQFFSSVECFFALFYCWKHCLCELQTNIERERAAKKRRRRRCCWSMLTCVWDASSIY